MTCPSWSGGRLGLSALSSSIVATSLASVAAVHGSPADPAVLLELLDVFLGHLLEVLIGGLAERLDQPASEALPFGGTPVDDAPRNAWDEARAELHGFAGERAHGFCSRFTSLIRSTRSRVSMDGGGRIVSLGLCLTGRSCSGLVLSATYSSAAMSPSIHLRASGGSRSSSGLSATSASDRAPMSASTSLV